MARRILVVEDDPEFRALVAKILEGWGHTVFQAEGVTEALRLAKELRPDTVVTDLGLLDGDGFSLTADLVALPDPARVIVISSDARAGNLATALRAGAVGFLPKDQLLSDAMRCLIEQP